MFVASLDQGCSGISCARDVVGLGLHLDLFRLVGSKQILNLSLPSLSLPSTKTKLLIQGVAWCTGFRIQTCNILPISCLNGSLRCTGTDWKGVCLAVTLGSICIWYGGPGKHPISSKTSG